MRNAVCLLFLILGSALLQAQSTFDPESYIQYRETIKNMEAEQLLQKYPSPAVYYSERKYPTSSGSFNYLDSINERFQLTNSELELISQNHFMVSERLNYPSFAQAMLDLYFSDLPLFLSTDLFLHAMHLSYDNMLKDIEYQLLEPNLLSLLTSMRNELGIMKSTIVDPVVLQSLKDVDLYLAVAFSLLKDESITPLFDDSGDYPVLMDGIAGEDGILNISVFAEHVRKLDMSQFKPRGHYADEFWTSEGKRDLCSYFKAMTWLGRIDFYLTQPPANPWEDPWSDEDIRRMQMAALLLNDLIDKSGEKDLLDLHEKIIGFFVGDSDNMTPEQLKDLTDELGINPSSLLDNETYISFSSRLAATNDYGQKIMSAFFYVDPDTIAPGNLPVSYRILGQKFILDSYVFSELVYDRISYQDKKVYRALPDPLDLLFVLGNDNALPLLKDELENYHYSGKIEGLRYLVDQYDPLYWESSLYTNWLKAIRDLNPSESTSDLPYFMQTSNWQLQKMNTQLASWAELRHDNILYAKQSYTGGTGCTYQHVYLEPYPDFYETLYQFAANAEDFFLNELSGYSIQSYDGIVNYYKGFGEIMIKLKALAEKELRREVFSNDEICWLKSVVNGAMASGPSISGWFLDLFYDKIKALNEDYIVADVHTQPTDQSGNLVGRVLHVGTGNINLGVFCAEAPSNNYQPTAFIGPLLSFHTKVTRDFLRYNDQEWYELFASGQNLPERPDWVYNYLADEKGEPSQEVRDLRGVLYESNGENPSTNWNNIAYLIMKPNPANFNTSIRFVLNQPAEVMVSVYDFLGRRTEVLVHQTYNLGENNLQFDASNYSKGMYLLEMKAGVERKVLKFLVE